MIELLSEEKIESYDYLRIRCEFYDLWNRLFLNKDRIDSKAFGKFWTLKKLISRTRFQDLWFIPKFAGSILGSELILRSNQLWTIRNWEYPWALLNSSISPDTKILDVGSGWSLFPLYLARKSSHVDSIDTDERQMKVLSPVLAEILKVKVNYSVDDALHLSAKDNTYNYVFGISVLEHLEEEIENGIYINRHARKLDRIAIKEFVRVIRPGGRVIITVDYGIKHTSPRSFDFDYIKDLISEFSSNLLKPLENPDSILFTEEKGNEMRRLWPEFFPYDPAILPATALGIILTKR